MSKADWLGISPTSGSGNQQITVTSLEANTGRNIRNTTIVVKSSAGEIEIPVEQEGVAANIKFDSLISNATVEVQGKDVIINGTANTFDLGVNIKTNDGWAILKSFTVNGSSVAKSTDYSAFWTATTEKDPGASQAYTFQVIVTVAINSTDVERDVQLSLSGSDAETKYYKIVQKTVGPQLKVDSTSLSIGASAGSQATFNIYDCTTSWTIE